MDKLLEKTRRINKLIQKAAGQPVEFQEMAKALTECLTANTYIADRRGTILGYALMADFECEIMLKDVLKKGEFPVDYNEKLLRVTESLPNVTQEKRRCVFKKDEPCIYEQKVTTVIPIYGGGERLGTLLLARYNNIFTDEDLILAEYAGTMLAMEMMRSRAEKAEEEARKKAAVQVAIGTLSYSELEAIHHIFDELNGSEGFLVASKIADRVGITRSVIVNALRKFESAGVIESRSLGMKGTYIRVLNDRLVEELRKIR